MPEAGASPPGARLRVALFGSPAFALPALEALHRRHQVLLVVAQPDKKAGRGLRVASPATAGRARELAIPLAQPARLKGNEDFAARLRRLELDVAVTAAYGKILPASLLAVPRHGFLNVHASLLPKYRGAAPVQWALIHRERETGVSIMRTEAGLDTGPVCLQRTLPIPDGAGASKLMTALADLGADALLEALDALASAELSCHRQDDDLATQAPMLTREDGRIRWQDPAAAVAARHRGVELWPGSHFRFAGDSVKVAELTATSETSGGAEPGTVLRSDGAGLLVACGAGSVRLLRVQPPGKRVMAARDWGNGRGVRPGVRLG